jgi:hypothetical protein
VKTTAIIETMAPDKQQAQRDFRNRQDQQRGGRGSDEQAWDRDGGRQSNYGGASQLNTFEQQYEGERGNYDQGNYGRADQGNYGRGGGQQGYRDEAAFGDQGGEGDCSRSNYGSGRAFDSYRRGNLGGQYQGGYQGGQYQSGSQESQYQGEEYSRGYRREERYPDQQEGGFQQGGSQYRRGINFEDQGPVSYGQGRRSADTYGAQGFADSTDQTGYGMGDYRQGGSQGSSSGSFAGRGPRGYRPAWLRVLRAADDLCYSVRAPHFMDLVLVLVLLMLTLAVLAWTGSWSPEHGQGSPVPAQFRGFVPGLTPLASAQEDK